MLTKRTARNQMLNLLNHGAVYLAFVIPRQENGVSTFRKTLQSFTSNMVIQEHSMYPFPLGFGNFSQKPIPEKVCTLIFTELIKKGCHTGTSIRRIKFESYNSDWDRAKITVTWTALHLIIEFTDLEGYF